MSASRNRNHNRKNRQRPMNRVTDPDIVRALGRIEGKIDGIQTNQQEHSKKLGGLDERLRHVERRSAVHGATAGMVSATGVTIIVEYLRRSMGL